MVSRPGRKVLDIRLMEHVGLLPHLRIHLASFAFPHCSHMRVGSAAFPIGHESDDCAPVFQY